MLGLANPTFRMPASLRGDFRILIYRQPSTGQFYDPVGGQTTCLDICIFDRL